jgi:hypothetical protein
MEIALKKEAKAYHQAVVSLVKKRIAARLGQISCLLPGGSLENTKPLLARSFM